MKLRENHLYTNGTTTVMLNEIWEWGDEGEADDIVYTIVGRMKSTMCTDDEFRKRYPYHVDRIEIVRE